MLCLAIHLNGLGSTELAWCELISQNIKIQQKQKGKGTAN